MRADRQRAAPARTAHNASAAGERLDSRILADADPRDDDAAEGAHVAPGDRVDPLRTASLERGSARTPDPLLIDARGLAAMLSISVRHIRAMRARGGIPEPLAVGRRRLWRVAEVAAWVAVGMPSADRWQREGGQR